MGLGPVDKALVRLFMAATFHHWKALPGRHFGSGYFAMWGARWLIVLVFDHAPMLKSSNLAQFRIINPLQGTYLIEIPEVEPSTPLHGLSHVMEKDLW